MYVLIMICKLIILLLFIMLIFHSSGGKQSVEDVNKVVNHLNGYSVEKRCIASRTSCKRRCNSSTFLSPESEFATFNTCRYRQRRDRFSMKKPLRLLARGARFHTKHASNANVDPVV
jgi:hypothetical protein